MYCLFIDENTVEMYNGEVLKRYVGNRLVKAISNPTEQDLKDFTYMELVEGTAPEYDAETQYIKKTYRVQDGKVYETCTAENIPEVTDGDE